MNIDLKFIGVIYVKKKEIEKEGNINENKMDWKRRFKC